MFSRSTVRVPTLALALALAAVGVGACGSVATKSPDTDGPPAGTGGDGGADSAGSAGQSGGGGTTGTGGASSAGGSGAGGSGGSAGIAVRGAIRPLSSVVVGSTVRLIKQSLSLPAPTVCSSSTCLVDSSLSL